MACSKCSIIDGKLIEFRLSPTFLVDGRPVLAMVSVEGMNEGLGDFLIDGRSDGLAESTRDGKSEGILEKKVDGTVEESDVGSIDTVFVGIFDGL